MTPSLLPVSDWPCTKKLFGIAHGWPGAAWVALKLDQSGLLPANARITVAIETRLKRRAKVEWRDSICTSHLIGSGSYPLIASTVAAAKKLPLTLFLESLAAWRHDCGKSSASDVMMGAAGALLACAEIEGMMPGRINSHFLRKLRDDVEAGLQRLLADMFDGNPVYLGFSHGIAGYLFALEMCNSVFGLKFEHSLRTECFDAITAGRMRLTNNAMVWPKKSGEDSITYHSWCHGAPGIALALLYSYKLTSFDAYHEIAEQALEGTYRFELDSTSFCCGATGRAQILVEAFRVTGNSVWLQKAKKVAAKIQLPSGISNYNRGFHAGRLGYEYLLWRLKHPTLLSLPGLGIFS